MQAGIKAREEKKKQEAEKDKKFWGWFSDTYQKIKNYQSKLNEGIAEAVAGRKAREKYQAEYGWMDSTGTRRSAPKMQHGGLTRVPTLAAEDGSPEAVVPLTPERFANFMRRIDPKAARLELAKNIETIQDTSKEKQKEDTKNAAMIAMNKPSFTPIPMNTGGDLVSTDKDKLPTNVDSKLDRFLSELLTDCSFEFGNRYKRYVYDSNIGFSFA